MEKWRIAETIVKEKNEVGGLRWPDFETYYKAVLIKKTWDQHKDKHLAQRNRIESLKLETHAYDQSSFDKGTKVIHWNYMKDFYNLIRKIIQ